MGQRKKIVIDAAIPYIRGVWDDFADVQYLPADEIKKENIRSADALVIRTRTKCDKELLQGSSVQAIASATIGYDHINRDDLAQLGINFSSAPGCNARSVAHYIGAALAYYVKQKNVILQKCCVGVVGCGHVGSEVIKVLEHSKIPYLKCDPFLHENAPNDYTSLFQIMQKCDVITLHTPLTFDGQYPTYRMIDEQILSLHQRKGLIINAARGGIIDEQALTNALDMGLFSAAIIDCWEDEPIINQALAQKALLATPHIAGYSAQGKFNATQAAVRYVSEQLQIPYNEPIAPAAPPQKKVTSENLLNEILYIYNIEGDSLMLKNAPQQFEQFRKNYPHRNELNYILL